MDVNGVRLDQILCTWLECGTGADGDISAIIIKHIATTPHINKSSVTAVEVEHISDVGFQGA